MHKVLIINGPNLNLLGEREKDKYGKFSLKDIEKSCHSFSKNNNINLTFFNLILKEKLLMKYKNLVMNKIV